MTFGLFIALTWFDSVCIRFDGTNRWSSFTTAGWFSIGFPFIAGMGLLYAAFVAYLSRRIHSSVAGLALVFILVLIVGAIRSGLPESRLAAIIGERAAQHATIECLFVADSFNDGVATWGIISGPEDLLESIANHFSVEVTPEMPPNGLQSYFPELFPKKTISEFEDQIPELGDAAGDKRSTFFRHPKSGKIYFGKFYRSDRK